jgi:hypothetical protein
MNYPIQSFWAGPMSDLEIMVLKSWVGCGHQVILYTYENIIGLPHGVLVADANDIIPGGPETYEGPAPRAVRADAFSLLPFSDRFRFTMLRMNGGLWLDMDMLLLKPIPTDLFAKEYFCASERTMRIGAYKSALPTKPTISALYCREPESDLMVELTNDRTKIKSAWHGMKLFQKVLTRMSLDIELAAEFFCDMNWWDINSIFITTSAVGTLPPKWGCPGTRIIPPNAAVGVHLWRGLLRKQGLKYEKMSEISPLSYLGRLYQWVEQNYQMSLLGL